MKFVQPSFSVELFERERQRQVDDAKARQALKQQDNDRRRRILETIAQRNKELYEQEAETNADDDLDCLDPEEEDARLGKRLKASILADVEENRPKKLYQVARPPTEEPVPNRDEMDEEIDGTLMVERYENSLINTEAAKASHEEQVKQRVSERQKSMGY